MKFSIKCFFGNMAKSAGNFTEGILNGELHLLGSAWVEQLIAGQRSFAL